MNKLQANASNGGNGIYGWDLINPYLQELYQNQDEDSSDEIEIPRYIAPLPGEIPTPSFEPLPRREPSIPLKPDYPVNPDPTTPAQEPRKLRSLTEGFDLAGKRIWNDLKYSRGYIQDFFSDDDRADAAQSALEHLPEYEHSSPSQLQQKADSLNQIPKQKPVDHPRIELKGLEEYRRLREERLPQGEIARQLSETARWGNEGKRIMEEARATNNAFPETEGMASVGAFSADIARIGIPVALAALSAPAGAVAGAINIGSSVAESHAQAQMELDNYEEKIGQPLSKTQRTIYTAICMGADFLFDTLLQSRYLGNVKSGLKKRASKYFKKELLKNKAAQTEANKLMKNLARTDRNGIYDGIIHDAVAGGVSEGFNSVAHDMGQMVYANPDDYPTLNAILQNATSSMVLGAATGSVAGGIGRVANLHKKNTRRDRQEMTALLDEDGNTWEVFDYNPESRIATVLLPRSGKLVDVPDVSPDRIKYLSTHETRQDARIAREINEPDPLESVLIDHAKDEVWAKMSTRGKYLLTQDLAKRMGLENVLVYEREADLPPSVLKTKNAGERIGGFYMENGDIGIVLENIGSYERLQRAMLHEAVGHMGLNALFGNSYFKDEFLMKVYESMPAIWKLSGSSWAARKEDAEEYLASLAARGKDSSAWQQICNELRATLRFFYPGLKFSNSELAEYITLSRDALRNENTITEMNEKLRHRLSPEYEKRMGAPLSEIEEAPYRLLWENNPQWQRYKRFYDEVYGDPLNPSGTPDSETGSEE